MIRPLKILFDAEPLVAAGKSGVGHYTGYLVRAIAEAYPDDVDLVGHYYNFLGRSNVSGLPDLPNISYRTTRFTSVKVVNMLRRFGISPAFELLARTRGDAILFPNFLTLPSLFKAPSVVTIHDLCFLEYPEFVSSRNLHDLQRYVPQSIARASLVLATSNFTKQSLMKAYELPSKKVVITPVPPFEKLVISSTEAEALTAKLGIRKQYLLFVGNLEPRKNLESLLEAYNLSDQKITSDYSLVLAGGRGWKNEILQAKISALQAAGVDIITTGYISDEQKAALYSRASLVVLPSYYEGFGMPILEAFQYGVAVAVSDIAVLREVAGDAAAYFDPHDAADMAKVIGSVLQHAELRKRLTAKQPAQLTKYSWSDTAQRVVTAMREIIYE